MRSTTSSRASSESLEDAFPELITPDSPTQRVGASADRAVRARAASRADAVARQRVLVRGAGHLGGPRRQGARRRDPVVRMRAEDRRRRLRAHVRAGRARPRSHARGRAHRARTSPPTCGRSVGVPNRLDAGRSARDRGDPGRGVSPGHGLRAAQRRAARRGTEALRQPPQRRGRVVAAEGPEGDRLPPAAPVGPFVRSGRGCVVRLASGVPRLGGLGRAAGGADHRAPKLHRGRPCVPAPLGGAPTLRRLGDRRRGDQGRSDRSAARARRDVARAPMGDRLQVPPGGAHESPGARSTCTPAAPAR